jgi:hypothetical protein
VNRFGVYDLNLDFSPPPIAKRATKAVNYDVHTTWQVTEREYFNRPVFAVHLFAR